MAVSVKDVDNLNKRIEKINLDYTKRKTQRDMLKEHIESGIKAYMKEFGVNLGGSNIEEIRAKITEEYNKIVKTVEDEYQLKLKVVQAIEDGNYEEAGKLLGVNEDSEEGNEGISVGESETEAKDEEPSVVEWEEGEPWEEVDNTESSEENMDSGEVSENDEEETSIAGFEDDEEELEVSEDMGNSLFMSAVAKANIKGSSVKDAVQGMGSDEEDDGVLQSVDIASLEVEDDEDDEEDGENFDFGFGDMLSGTKFE